jgi:ketosteroid isomerase-like protein
MPPHCPACHGRAAARKWMADFPRATHFRFEYHDIDGRDDLAYVRGAYFITVQPEGAPEPVEDVGKFLEICRKQPDGSWLLVVDTFNSDK